MENIYNTMRQFFKQDGWITYALEDELSLQMRYEGENGQWTCYAEAEEADQQLLFYSLCPLKIPEGREAEIAEYLTRANYGLPVGNFEMDYDDGTIRYKTSLDVEDDKLSHNLIRNIVFANLQVMDHYLPGLMRVVFDKITPFEAILEIEEG